MQNVLQCDCGFEVHAAEEADLVARVQQHALEMHQMELSPEDVLHLAFRAELGEATWPLRLGREATEDADRRDQGQRGRDA